MTLHTLWPDSQTAVVPNASDGGAAGITTGTVLIFGAEGTVPSIHFLAPVTVGPGETWTVGLWVMIDNTSGTLLDSRSVLGATLTGGAWNTVDLNAPISVDHQHAYVASAWSSAGRYVATNGYFSTSHGDPGMVYGPADGENIGTIVPWPSPIVSNGRFLDNAPAGFPNFSAGSTSYFVDAVWDDGAPSGFFDFFQEV